MHIPRSSFPDPVPENHQKSPDGAPLYTLEPSLPERLSAQKIQLTEGRKLVGTAAELQAQRERMEVSYRVPVGEVDIEEALV